VLGETLDAQSVQDHNSGAATCSCGGGRGARVVQKMQVGRHLSGTGEVNTTAVIYGLTQVATVLPGAQDGWED